MIAEKTDELTILIPFASGAKGNGALISIQPQESPPETVLDGFSADVAELYPVGLDSIAEGVRAATDQFYDARCPGWPSRLAYKPRPSFLRLTKSDNGHVGRGNQDSAGLGLAAAFLYHKFYDTADIVFATGKVITDTSSNSKLPIQEIGHLKEKLELFSDYLETNANELKKRSVHVLFPRQNYDPNDPDRDQDIERELERIQSLCDPHQISLKVMPLDAFKEIVESDKRWAPRMDRRFKFGMLTLTLAILVWAAIGINAWCVNRPIDIAFGGLRTFNIPAGAPTRARYDNLLNQYVIRPTCRDRVTSQPLIAINETLLIHPEIHPAHLEATLLERGALSIVGVGSQSDPVVVDQKMFRGLNGVTGTENGPDNVAIIPVRPPAEDLLIVLTAERTHTSTSDVIDDLNSAIEDLEGEARLNRAEAFLRDRYPGFVAYRYRSVAKSPCTEE
ncbi:MAG: hypothetical protein CSA72_02680 [Rhodobacterales bacterium]|nr:MAG: hypothetical protein CSA72_02680 [Rhodobacterales bacterium]